MLSTNTRRKSAIIYVSQYMVGELRDSIDAYAELLSGEFNIRIIEVNTYNGGDGRGKYSRRYMTKLLDMIVNDMLINDATNLEQHDADVILAVEHDFITEHGKYRVYVIKNRYGVTDIGKVHEHFKWLKTLLGNKRFEELVSKHPKSFGRRVMQNGTRHDSIISVVNAVFGKHITRMNLEYYETALRNMQAAKKGE